MLLNTSKRALSFLLFIAVLSSHSQEFKIVGKVLDSISKEPLEAATVFVESPGDSTLITYGITDRDGNFLLEDRSKHKKGVIFFSYTGYRTVEKLVALDNSVELGIISMVPETQQLAGVEVVGDRIPIRVKKDTLEFNAASFKTRPDANVEDVLKKLPGVQVNSKGDITVNGKGVDRVLVNGQVFITDDPTVATKNLPKEIIDKIQITDTKTERQEFMGEQGDGTVKTINLTIKPEKNNGFLGQAYLGYGSDVRRQLNTNVNFFNAKRRLSVLGNSSNIQNQGANQGITSASSFGGNYALLGNKGYDLNGNYFLNVSDNENKQQTIRENLLPTGSFFVDTEAEGSSNTSGHRGTVKFKFDIGKTFRITLEPVLNVTNTESSQASSTNSFDSNGNLLNSSTTARVDDQNGRQFSNQLNAIKKLDNKGSYLSLLFNTDLRSDDGLRTFSSERSIFAATNSIEAVSQQTTAKNTNDNYNFDLKYRQAFGDKLAWDVGYLINSRVERSNTSVFDFDSTQNGFTVFNEALSTDYNLRTAARSPYLGMRYKNKKLELQLKANYQFTTLENQDFLRGASFSRNYDNLLPSIRANYLLSLNKFIQLNYHSNLSTPTTNQVQPVNNINDPLNILVGNVDLNPTIRHNVSLNYTSFNLRSGAGVFLFSGFNVDKDRIVNRTLTDENFVRTTDYVNIDGNYSGNFSLGYSRQIKKDTNYTFRYDVAPAFNFTRNENFTNGARLVAKTWVVAPNLGLSFNYKELLEVAPKYTLAYNRTTYSLDVLEKQEFVQHNLNFESTLYWPKNVIWGNDFGYTYNSNVGQDFDRDALLWNMSLGVQFFKKRLTANVLAYDLLNQNINTRRTTGQDFIEDVQGNLLQRYFIFSLNFKFDKFGVQNAGFEDIFG